MASSAAARWLSAHVEDGFAVRRDSLVAARELVAAGVGRAVLPRFLGDVDARLRMIAGLDIAGELWILAHADLVRSARVRAFTAFAFDHLQTKGYGLLAASKSVQHIEAPGPAIISAIAWST